METFLHPPAGYQLPFSFPSREQEGEVVEQWGKGEKTSRNARVRISQLIFRSRCENAEK